MNRQGSRHFFISIPRVLLQRRESSNRKYFAYEIQITPVLGGENDKWSVLRRYSEFHRLDKYLQMSNPMVKTLDFPPKKSFGNMVSKRIFKIPIYKIDGNPFVMYYEMEFYFQNAEFVEMRRQRLQVYLLGVLSMMPEVLRCTTRFQLEQAFPFFKQSHQL